jgi:hypothetical protein
MAIPIHTVQYEIPSFLVFIFPRRATDVFEILEPETKRQVRIKDKDDVKDFEKTASRDIPKIKDHRYGDEVQQWEHIRDRELYFFANKNEQTVTVCILRCDREGYYYLFDNKQGSEDSEKFENYFLQFTVPEDENETGKEITWEYDDQRANVSLQEGNRVPLTASDCYFRFNIKVTVNNGGTPPDRVTAFKMAATITRRNAVDNTYMVMKEKKVAFAYSPYRGWTLTKDGELKQGGTGYLIDENDLYILKDGRRVSEEIITMHDYKEDETRVGVEDAGVGFKEIFGVTQALDEKIKMSYISDENVNLFKKHGPQMPLVEFQAFQINICYKGTFTAGAPFRIDNSSGAFYSIGTDETGIPIVVTRVGDPNALRKLVIACPHGDERNAQRLIMALQKHFIEEGPRTSTVIYFIPSLSPTMTFADVRGIPNKFWKKTGDETWKMGEAMKVNEGGYFDGKFELITDLKIPALHDELARKYDSTNNRVDIIDEVNGTLLRTLIQDQKDPFAPKWGVDANRDVTYSLKSNDAFIDFIVMLEETHIPPRNRMTSTRVIFSDIYNNNKEVESPLMHTINNFRVLMIHGYDNTQHINGSVYGPYYMHENDDTEKWSARMSVRDKMYVNVIKSKLNWGTVAISGQNRALVTTDQNDLFLFGNCEHNSYPYQGEWTWHLLRQRIWSADIELPNGILDEGIRNGPIGREYISSRIGVLSQIEPQFINLIKNFEWDIPEAPS